MEHIENMDWENIPTPAEYAKELKKIRKNLRKRNALVVLTSLVLVAALLFGTVQYGIPALESRYWDPRTVSYGTEAGTDLDMVLAAYTDLFSPKTLFQGTQISHTGFASYSITVMTLDETTNEIRESYCSIEESELFIPHGVWDTVSFDKVGNYWYSMTEEFPEKIVQQRDIAYRILGQLPSYVRVSAYVTFKEEKTLWELFDFRDGLSGVDWYDETHLLWTDIRHGDKMDNSPRCGFSASTLTDIYSEVNKRYPAFSERQAYDELYQYEERNSKEKTYTAHFKSLLKYLDDQLKSGTGIPAPASATGEIDMNYYTNVLAYVEENGVKATGCYIVSTPEHLLKIMERDDVLVVIPDEGWLNI